MAGDTTPEQLAIQDKREALRKSEEQERAETAKRRGRKEPEVIFDPTVRSFVRRASQANTSSLSARGRLFAFLVFSALIGAPIWLIYAVVSVGVFGCGPSGPVLQFPPGNWVGGAAASAPTAAAVGGLLWAAGCAAAWRLHQRTGSVLLVFTALYVAALLILSLVVSPAIWGPRHCGIPNG